MNSLEQHRAAQAFFRDHPGEAFDESAAKVEFAVERWGSTTKELEPLFLDHYAEIESEQQQIPLEMDWVQYGQLDREGKIHLVTARDDGWLVGYDFGVIVTHLHHRNSLQCFTDGTYLMPKYRVGLTGYLMMKFFRDTLLKAHKVEKINLATSLVNDVDRIFARLGYKPTYRSYSLVLKHG